MKTSNRLNFGFIGGKLMMGLVLAAVIGSMNVLPALGDNDKYRNGKHDDDRYEHRKRGNDRGRYMQDRREYRSDRYRERVYAPPRVFFEPPPPPPGIGIFFPPIFIRP